MELIPIKCPQCDADIRISDDKEFVRCEYCGTNIFFGRVDNGRLSAKNFIKLAETAQRAGNYTEAHYYYTKALEEDADSFEGWKGKAECHVKLAGRDGTKIRESVTYFENALKLAGKDEKNKLQWSAADIYSNMGSDLFYSRGNNSYDIDWVIFLFECSLVFIPYNLDVMKNIVNVCHDSERQDLVAKMYEYEMKILEHDENYTSIHHRKFTDDGEEKILASRNAIKHDKELEKQNTVIGCTIIAVIVIFILLYISGFFK